VRVKDPDKRSIFQGQNVKPQIAILDCLGFSSLFFLYISRIQCRVATLILGLGCILDAPLFTEMFLQYSDVVASSVWTNNNGVVFN